MKLFLNKKAKRYIERYLFTFDLYMRCKDPARETELEGKLSEMEFVLDTVLEVPESAYKHKRKSLIDDFTSTDIFRGFI